MAPDKRTHTTRRGTQALLGTHNKEAEALMPAWGRSGGGTSRLHQEGPQSCRERSSKDRRAGPSAGVWPPGSLGVSREQAEILASPGIDP